MHISFGPDERISVVPTRLLNAYPKANAMLDCTDCTLFIQIVIAHYFFTVQDNIMRKKRRIHVWFWCEVLFAQCHVTISAFPQGIWGSAFTILFKRLVHKAEGDKETSSDDDENIPLENLRDLGKYFCREKRSRHRGS